MTNKEKFIEVFGLEPDTVFCPIKNCSSCSYYDNGCDEKNRANFYNLEYTLNKENNRMNATLISIQPGKELNPCENCKYLDGDGCRLIFEQIEYGKASDECPNDNNVSMKNTISHGVLEQEPYKDGIIEWKNDFKGYVNSLSMPKDDYNGIMKYIDELPVNQTGYWIDIGSGQRCSRCGQIQHGYNSFRRFCASCGAIMIDPQKSEDK